MSPKDENRDQDLSKSRDYLKMLQTCPFNLQDVTQTQDALTPTISFSQSNDTLRRYNLQMIQSSLSEFSRLRAHTSSTLREIQNATHAKRTHLFNSNFQSFTAQEEVADDVTNLVFQSTFWMTSKVEPTVVALNFHFSVRRGREPSVGSYNIHRRVSFLRGS